MIREKKGFNLLEWLSALALARTKDNKLSSYQKDEYVKELKSRNIMSFKLQIRGIVILYLQCNYHKTTRLQFFGDLLPELMALFEDDRDMYNDLGYIYDRYLENQVK